jgi:heme o synthase
VADRLSPPVLHDGAETVATAPARVERSTVGAYVALTKPRIIELLLVTTVPPMFLAAGGWPSGWLVLATLVGGTLTAGAANVFNMVRDRDIDAVMARTRNRPIPAGEVGVGQAVAFGSVIGTAGVLLLWAVAGTLAAALAAGAMGFYVGVYSYWLKRTTVHNIVIGGAAGAAPCLIGWAAVTGTIEPAALVLFLVVFLWTPPHFWALAIVCERDYASAEVPMLPSVSGSQVAAWRSLRYAVGTVVASLALVVVEPRVGALYVAAAVAVGSLFLLRAARLVRRPEPAEARGLFGYSILYLAVLFVAVAVDQVVHWPLS